VAKPVQRQGLLRGSRWDHCTCGVGASARLFLAGRVAQFGRSLVGDVSRQLFAEFGRNMETTITRGAPTAPSQLRAGVLLWHTIAARVAELGRWARRRLARRG